MQHPRKSWLLKWDCGKSLQRTTRGVDGDANGFKGSYTEERLCIRSKNYSARSDFSHKINFGEAKLVLFDGPAGEFIHRFPNGLDADLPQLCTRGQRIGSSGINKEIGFVSAVRFGQFREPNCDVSESHDYEISSDQTSLQQRSLGYGTSTILPMFLRPSMY